MTRGAYWGLEAEQDTIDWLGASRGSLMNVLLQILGVQLYGDNSYEDHNAVLCGPIRFIPTRISTLYFYFGHFNPLYMSCSEVRLYLTFFL